MTYFFTHMSIGTGEVKHRDSRLRGFQNSIAAYIPGIIGFFDMLGAFPETKIHEVVNDRSKILQADDITLSQLQMTSHICKIIEQKELFPGFGIQYILTSCLNGADGPVARRLGTVSKEGGIKDATVDRLSEVMVAKLITKERDLPEDVSHKLQVAFQLSTLTKAACEMSDVKTSEGGIGGMIERRKTLFFILQDLIALNNLPQAMSPIRERITKSVDRHIKLLIEGSFERAKERIEHIAKSTTVIAAPDDPESSGASEARKYAGVVMLNNRMGIDIVSELNALANGSVVFPTAEELKERQPYIEETLGKAQYFLDEALSIAGY